MTVIKQSDKINYNTNLSKNQTYIYIVGLEDSKQLWVDWSKNKRPPVYWSKYSIKETDMRVKTAKFTSPQYVDLTNGVYAVLITSPTHEDFGGLILDIEYDEDTGLYTYQCQDWSRKRMSEFSMNPWGVMLYNILRTAITNCNVPLNPTQKEIDNWKNNLSGLRPIEEYNQLNWGGTRDFNPMTSRLNLVIREKKAIEIIRDLVFSLCPNTDVYIDKYGIIQIEPYSSDDYRHTGVHIDRREISDVKIKFDTTNIITKVYVVYDEKTIAGEVLNNQKLADFFGMMGVIEKNTAKIDSTTKSTTSNTTTNTNGNPYGNKAKKIWINSDNGSGGMKSSIINLLKNKGWTVHDGGTCSNCHYSGYFDVSSDYQVYATLYNGFCAGTIREAYSSKIQNVLKNKGVTLVVMWDTSGWTNPQGMAPYKYGDFSGYNAGRAWDDNFSSSDPSINNVSSWLKSNNAIYCANPTAEGIVNQFLAGGYFKSTGK